MLALLGEVGELAEIVQWKGDDGDNEDGNEEEEKSPVDNDASTTTISARFSPAERDHLSQEIADVSIYLLRLVGVTNTTEALMNQLVVVSSSQR